LSTFNDIVSGSSEDEISLPDNSEEAKARRKLKLRANQNGAGKISRYPGRCGQHSSNGSFEMIAVIIGILMVMLFGTFWESLQFRFKSILPGMLALLLFGTFYKLLQFDFKSILPGESQRERRAFDAIM